MAHSARDINLRRITRVRANALVRRLHYSHAINTQTQLHIGVFLNGHLEGALQFGAPMHRRQVIGIVADTAPTGMTELLRLAFSDVLPRNSESRAIAVALRMLRRDAPQIEWVLSYADATQCGDGAIYRAAGFVLTQIQKSNSLARLPSGQVVHRLSVDTTANRPRTELGGRSLLEVTGGRYSWSQYLEAAGATVLPGYQLRYVYFLNPDARARLTVPEIPYSEIARLGAGMYRGRRAGSIDGDALAPPGKPGRFDSDLGASID